MNINITLAVQAIHFIIAYILLHRLLFNPVLRIIQHEEHIEHTALLELEKARLFMEKREMYKNDQWDNLRNFFTTSAPTLISIDTELITTPLYDKQLLNQDEKQQAAKALAALIAKKVVDVY